MRARLLGEGRVASEGRSALGGWEGGEADRVGLRRGVSPLRRGGCCLSVADT